MGAGKPQPPEQGNIQNFDTNLPWLSKPGGRGWEPDGQCRPYVRLPVPGQGSRRKPGSGVAAAKHNGARQHPQGPAGRPLPYRSSVLLCRVAADAQTDTGTDCMVAHGDPAGPGCLVTLDRAACDVPALRRRPEHRAPNVPRVRQASLEPSSTSALLHNIPHLQCICSLAVRSSGSPPPILGSPCEPPLIPIHVPTGNCTAERKRHDNLLILDRRPP
ncbi:uncharacterized protein B0I36DRAFT_408997 [Microdochium trichocladiopsis]|uniref:Uncharacterized protein n=1 Tax=Microdochium trichocladiopsis TaxID=1682393 RepID=A0A9P9BQE5_9PEZI|nr:uncharacterized protein B0I36DRAFT_408997 [Microdochium trichocladiopsis]KAH7030783.1 hypothetical protein B0I36DRAFT_408997 [Microdochium trichocladiopsis]